MGGQADAVTRALTGEVFFSLVVAAVLAFVVSFVLLRWYLAAVKRAMRRSSGSARESAASGGDQIAAPPSASLQIVDVSHAEPANSAARGIAGRARAGRWQVLAVYGLAATAYAVSLTAIYLWAKGFELTPVRFALVLVWNYWPLVITAWLVWAIDARERIIAAAIYLAALAATTLPFLSPQFSVLSAVLGWMSLNVLPTLTAFVFLARRIRAAGPLVAAFLFFAVSGVQLVFHVVGEDDANIRRLAEIGSALGLGGVATFFATAMVGALVLGIVGWGALRIVGAAYRARRLSDQSIVISALWLIFTAFESMMLAFDGVRWFFVGLVTFVLFQIAAAIGFRIVRGTAATDHDAPKLLLLRVFSLGKRSERLFDRLSRLWRHAGSIRMIAGPDLATTTVEPHEFLDFVGGRLARRFIADRAGLEQRLAETTARRDPDGRFRVNDFFCHDDTWKMVLGALAADSDAVLMDLRGFGPSNSGCVYEIHELLSRVPLERFVLVIDETTDKTFLNRTLTDGWTRISAASPNRNVPEPQVRIFPLDGIAAGRLLKLVGTLATAAASKTA